MPSLRSYNFVFLYGQYINKWQIKFYQGGFITTWNEHYNNTNNNNNETDIYALIHDDKLQWIFVITYKNYFLLLFTSINIYWTWVNRTNLWGWQALNKEDMKSTGPTFSAVWFKSISQVWWIFHAFIQARTQSNTTYTQSCK